MKWWIWLWLGTITWLTVGGAWDDVRDGRRAIGIGLGVAAGVSCVVSVLAFAVEPLGVALGTWLIPLSLGAGLQIVADAIKDLRALSPDSELTARENRVIEVGGVAAVGFVFGAAVVVGVLTGVREW
jgi:hypothetical protein